MRTPGRTGQAHDANTSALYLLSGGMDSATALALDHHAAPNAPRTALNITYGQRNHAEIAAAKAVADHYGARYIHLDLSDWGAQLTGCSFTDPDVDVPMGPYTTESHGDGTLGNTGVTVVPSRNGTFVFAAAGIAQALGHTEVVIANHADDHAVYPDCRPAFIDALNTALDAGTAGAVSVRAPFVHLTKHAIATLGLAINTPYNLTWSCYTEGPDHCGTCGTCMLRHGALSQNGHTDPTRYAVTPKAHP